MIVLIRIAFFAYLGWLVIKTLRKRFRGHEKTALDPYEILGIAPNAKPEDIKSAYKKGLAEYHPDKVEHLGSDLQDLAVLRTQQIIWAYNKIK